MSFLWSHWYLCFRLMVMSPLGFKARGGSLIQACKKHLCYMCNLSHLLTSWQPAWQLTCSLPCTSEYQLVRVETGTYLTIGKHPTNWDVPAQLESKQIQHFHVAFFVNWIIIFFLYHFIYYNFFFSVLKSTQATHISQRKRNTTACSLKIWEVREVWDITLYYL